MNIKKWTQTLYSLLASMSDVAELPKRMVGHTLTEQLSGTLI